MQYVSPVSHQLTVLRRGVHTLTVHDRPLKHVTELRLGTQEVGTREVYHAPVFQQVILERVTGQYHSTPKYLRKESYKHFNIVCGKKH